MGLKCCTLSSIKFFSGLALPEATALSFLHLWTIALLCLSESEDWFPLCYNVCSTCAQNALHGAELWRLLGCLLSHYNIRILHPTRNLSWWSSVYLPLQDINLWMMLCRWVKSLHFCQTLSLRYSCSGLLWQWLIQSAQMHTFTRGLEPNVGPLLRWAGIFLLSL